MVGGVMRETLEEKLRIIKNKTELTKARFNNINDKNQTDKNTGIGLTCLSANNNHRVYSFLDIHRDCSGSRKKHRKGS